MIFFSWENKTNICFLVLLFDTVYFFPKNLKSSRNGECIVVVQHVVDKQFLCVFTLFSRTKKSSRWILSVSQLVGWFRLLKYFRYALFFCGNVAVKMRRSRNNEMFLSRMKKEVMKTVAE